MRGRPQVRSTEWLEECMHIMRRHGWELPERSVTSEAFVLSRRSALAGAGVLASLPALAQTASPPVDPKYQPGRALTSEKAATTYNNYYEFSESKNLWRETQGLKQRPWTIELAGELKQPRTIGIDDLLKQVQLEDRIYRH